MMINPFTLFILWNMYIYGFAALWFGLGFMSMSCVIYLTIFQGCIRSISTTEPLHPLLRDICSAKHDTYSKLTSRNISSLILTCSHWRWGGEWLAGRHVCLQSGCPGTGHSLVSPFRISTFPIAVKFGRRLGSDAAESPVKFQSDEVILFRF